MSIKVQSRHNSQANPPNQSYLMNVDVLAPLEEMIGSDLEDDERFKALRHEFYSMAIYEIAWHDILGSSPVYVINPKLKKIFDVKVLEDL